MQNILIYGASRCGKTTLAKKIANDLPYSYLSLDKLVHAFSVGMPQAEINHDDRTGKTVINFQKFILPYLRFISHQTKYSQNIYYCVEGAYLDLSQLIKQSFIKRYKLIILIYDNQDYNALFHKLKQTQSSEDWTSSLSDQKLLDYSKLIISDSARIKKICEENSLPYYDTSKNRIEILESIFNKIKEEV